MVYLDTPQQYSVAASLESMKRENKEIVQQAKAISRMQLCESSWITKKIFCDTA
jgi:hypothetical protein